MLTHFEKASLLIEIWKLHEPREWWCTQTDEIFMIIVDNIYDYIELQEKKRFTCSLSQLPRDQNITRRRISRDLIRGSTSTRYIMQNTPTQTMQQTHTTYNKPALPCIKYKKAP